MNLCNYAWLMANLDAGAGHYKTASLWAADNLVSIKVLVVWSF